MAAADPDDDPSGAPTDDPASPVAFGPENAAGYDAAVVGFCTKAINCKCQSVKDMDAKTCADNFTKQYLEGKTMPASLRTCFLQLSCDDLCADRTAAAESCVKSAVTSSAVA